MLEVTCAGVIVACVAAFAAAAAVHHLSRVPVVFIVVLGLYYLPVLSTVAGSWPSTDVFACQSLLRTIP